MTILSGTTSTGQILPVQVDNQGRLIATLTDYPLQDGTAIVSGTAQNSIAALAVEFTAIPNWAKRITVMFSGVSINTINRIYLQLGTAASIETTNYFGCVQIGTERVESYNLNESFQLTTALAGTSESVLHGSIVLSLLSSPLNLWTCSGLLARSDLPILYMTAGSKSLSAVLTTIHITMETSGRDEFDAGWVNILYE